MLKIFHKKFGDSYKTITFATDIRIFSCLFVKFVLYTSGVPWGGSSAFLFIICLSSQGVMGQCLFTEEPPLPYRVVSGSAGEIYCAASRQGTLNCPV